jgi:hypothetical protein
MLHIVYYKYNTQNQKSCPHQNFSLYKCVKQVYSLNKIKYDFTKCDLTYYTYNTSNKNVSS